MCWLALMLCPWAGWLLFNDHLKVYIAFKCEVVLIKELVHFTCGLNPRQIEAQRLFFSQLDLGIPAMTKCCDQLDVCYDTCGTSKQDCDFTLRWCLHGICADLKKSLGFVSKVQGETFTEPLPLLLGQGTCQKRVVITHV